MSNKRFQTRRIFPFQKFFSDSRAVGITLLACTAFSLLFTNFGEVGISYHNFWLKEIPLFHQLRLPHNVLHFVNDALMAIFFFHVGIEIKREAVVGELSSLKKALFPVIAALSGVIFPAVIFFLVTKGTGYERGWAIPTATDIAFSLGILAMVGRAVPFSIKIFLTALAIIDDLCAILIIAFFYGDTPKAAWLLGVAACVLVTYFIVRRYRHTKYGNALFLIVAAIAWFCMYNSGVHATFAGIVMAFLLPISKIKNFEKILEFPVSFIIIPIFALANTSLFMSVDLFHNLTSMLSIGIILGLVVGKPLGIMTATFLLTKSKIINLPKGVTMRKFVGVGFLAGIGFTMSIFVSTLSFADKTTGDTAKIAVLVASILSMILGYIWLKLSYPDTGEIEREVKVVVDEAQ